MNIHIPLIVISALETLWVIDTAMFAVIGMYVVLKFVTFIFNGKGILPW